MTKYSNKACERLKRLNSIHRYLSTLRVPSTFSLVPSTFSISNLLCKTQWTHVTACKICSIMFHALQWLLFVRVWPPAPVPLGWIGRWVFTSFLDARKGSGFHSRYAAHSCDRNALAMAYCISGTICHSCPWLSQYRKGPEHGSQLKLTFHLSLVRAQQVRFAKKRWGLTQHHGGPRTTPNRKAQYLQDVQDLDMDDMDGVMAIRGSGSSAQPKALSLRVF